MGLHGRGVSLPVEGRTRLVQKTDTADRQNIEGGGITMKNPGAGIQDREDKVSSSYCIINNCSSAKRKFK
jgi:hypothetical protein